jgi:hypothetical protein
MRKIGVFEHFTGSKHPFYLSCVYSLRSFHAQHFRHGPLRPVTMLRVGPGSNRSTGIDKLVASRTVEQS